MLKSLYKSILYNFKYEIVKLFALLMVIFLLLFLIAYSNEMTNIEFVEFLFMLKYKNSVFVALYTAFVGIVLLIFFRFVEIIDIVNIKEFAIRINNKKLLRKLLILSIIIFTAIFIIFLFIVSLLLSVFLKYNNLNLLQVIFSIILYIFFFVFFELCYFISCLYNKYKNLAYVLFVCFHLNNIFSILPGISVPNILLKCDINSAIFSILLFMFSGISLSWLAIRGNS